MKPALVWMMYALIGTSLIGFAAYRGLVLHDENISGHWVLVIVLIACVGLSIWAMHKRGDFN
jgi:hypothetical protein